MSLECTLNSAGHSANFDFFGTLSNVRESEGGRAGAEYAEDSEGVWPPMTEFMNVHTNLTDYLD